MTMQSLWSNTPFRNGWVREEWHSELPENLEDEASDDYEVQHSNEYDKLMQLVAELGPAEKRLYHLAIDGEYNTSGKLAEFTRLSRTTTYFLIKNLKQKLADGIRDSTP
jgi:DNA-binding CsgD family transcriptional regulator